MTTPAELRERMRGLIVAMTTPFQDDLSLDLDGLRRLTDFYAGAGVPAVIAAGSTGEFHALSDDERKRVIETVVEQAGGRMTVIAGCAHSGSQLALEMTRFAKDTGAGRAMITPIYGFSGFEGLHRHFELVASTPPSGSWSIHGAVLSKVTDVIADPALLARLCEIPHLVGFKDSTGNYAFYRDVSLLLQDRVAIMGSRRDGLLPLGPHLRLAVLAGGDRQHLARGGAAVPPGAGAGRPGHRRAHGDRARPAVPQRHAEQLLRRREGAAGHGRSARWPRSAAAGGLARGRPPALRDTVERLGLLATARGPAPPWPNRAPERTAGRPMRFVIAGAGAVGSLFAAHLARSGEAVTLVVRPAHGEAVRARGLRVVERDGSSWCAWPDAVETVGAARPGPEDVVVFTCKAYDTAGMVASWRGPPRRGCARWRACRTEWATEPAAGAVFPHVYGVMARFSARLLEPGVVLAAGNRELAFGRYPRGVDAVVEDLVGRVARSGIARPPSRT